MVSDRTRRALPLVSATLTIVGTVIAYELTESLKGSQSWGIILAWIVAGIIVTYLLSRVQSRSGEESSEAIKERVGQLHSELRVHVQSRSYGARSKLIAAPLKELDLDITPRVGWVRDPRLIEPETLSEENTGIVAAFASSKRRLLIVGEPGSGKTMAAYALIEHLDETEGDERIPLLVNLSAWEAQDNFEAFLVDYLCSEVGYQVRQRAIANAFISSRRFTLILDGLDEIPAGLRKQFSERLDEFMRGLPSEVAVVVTCRTQEYGELLDAHPTGLGLVQAVEMLPLTSQQLDSALAQLARFGDKDWEMFQSERHLTASQRARDLLSNPLFLNLAVAGHLNPRQLWECAEKQEPRDLVLERYLDRALADQGPYEPASARRYLTWVACFLNGAEVSPFGLKTSDPTVFDLADLTPPDPPRWYRLFVALAAGLMGLGLMRLSVLGLGQVEGLGLLWLLFALVFELVLWLGFYRLVLWLIVGLIVGSLAGWPFKRSAVSSRLTFVWPSTRRQLRNFLGRAVQGLVFGLVFGLVLALVMELIDPGSALITLFASSVLGLTLGLGLGLGLGLVDPQSVLITSRTPKEASSRSLVATLLWLVFGLVFVLGWGGWACGWSKS